MPQAATKLKSEFFRAITQLAAERGLAPETVLEAVEQAMISAYKKDFEAPGNVQAQVDPETGEVRIFTEKQVAEEVEDDALQITLAEARVLDPKAEVGGVVLLETTPPNFGRIAAQTAKQVILQRIREAEREAIFQSFSDRAGEIVSGTVQSIDSQGITLSLGRAEALLPKTEQVPGERYRLRQRIRAYVVEVNKTGRGPEILLSRAHKGMLRRLLELEVPEIYNGAVEIKSIAREPGSRSKVAVAALQPGIDPVGACVGMRGVRIQSIVDELGGEKIDVIEWSRDSKEFIAKALSPARPVSIDLVEVDGVKTAIAAVPEGQLSLAIGREGQNVRLAAKLTGWRIDILSPAEAQKRVPLLIAEAERKAEEARAAMPVPIEPTSLVSAMGLSTRVVSALEKAGITEVSQILEKLEGGEESLESIAGVGPKSRKEVLERLETAGLYPLPAKEEVVTPAEVAEEAAVTEEETAPEAVTELPEGPAVEEVGEEAPAKPFVEEEVPLKGKKKAGPKKREKPGRRRENWLEEWEMWKEGALEVEENPSEEEDLEIEAPEEGAPEPGATEKESS
ncbi:MAG: transcription termination/antitermination protein NusA [Chloroflexi bacterium]|nr:transcription termination/antitermination protein NusA [Chloroflexota bacterium]